MQENSKEFVTYESFDELPDELKEKFKSGARGWNLKQAKDGYVDFINLLSKRGDKLVGEYNSNKVKTHISFGDCDHIADIRPHCYKRDIGCGICGGKQVQRGINDLATTHPHLAKEWHIAKNGEITPRNVTQGSGKKVWWQCKYGHEWEARISDRTCGHDCPYCSNKKILKGYNDIATTHPHLIKYFVNLEDVYIHTYSSNKKVKLKCPDCGHSKTMSISNLTHQGLRCNICSDGISFSEKLMTLILTKLNIEFVKQMSYDNGEHRYDFYLPKYKAILETHGEQHYRGWLGNEEDLIRQQENDRCKRELAISKGILNEKYHEIDCRYSTLEWCRPNIEKALSNYIDMSTLDILADKDWKDADIQAQKSLKIEVCKHWNENKKYNEELNPKQVAEVFGVDEATVRNYLKWGSATGFCTYNRGHKLIYLIKPNGDKWFDEPMSMIGMARQTEISLATIHKSLDKGALKHGTSAKYDPKYIGSRIVSAEAYDNQHQTNQNT